MVQNEIEAILRQKLGLDANSIGSQMIVRGVEQRQLACQLDSAAYLAFLKSSPAELEQLIETVVIPETWFFRDTGPFELLQQVVRQPVLHGCGWHPGQRLRLLSVPCSTGEEPYSIAMTLLEAGLTPAQFQIDAVDISRRALQQAERGIYGKRSFRGQGVARMERYFQPVAEGWQVRPIVRQGVQFRRGNVLEPDFLVGQQYHGIFCRNLLIYLDQNSRQRVVDRLDQALLPQGLLFLGAVETTQVGRRAYRAIAHPRAFAYQKQPPTPATPAAPSDGSRFRWVPAKPVLEKPAPEKRASAKPAPEKPGTEKPGTEKSETEKLETGQEPRPLAQTQTTPASQRQPEPNPAETNLASVPVLPTPASDPLETASGLANRGELRLAAQLCQAYLRAHPAQARVYLLLGEIYQGLNQPRQAEQYFQKAIYLDPNAYEALIHLALLKQQQGRARESAQLKKRAQRLVDLSHSPSLTDS